MFVVRHSYYIILYVQKHFKCFCTFLLACNWCDIAHPHSGCLTFNVAGTLHQCASFCSVMNMFTWLSILTIEEQRSIFQFLWLEGTKEAVVHTHLCVKHGTILITIYTRIFSTLFFLKNGTKFGGCTYYARENFAKKHGAICVGHKRT